MVERIGVFICDCGTNIAEVINTRELADFASRQDDVTDVIINKLWCSEEGRKEMRKAIKERGITRVVVAACSPKQHEKTFRKVLSTAEMNPFLLAMANIREQVAWVTKDKKLATRKALAQLSAAIKRVRLQTPLEESFVECKGDFVVIGAGVAGMKAALTLAQQKNRTVYLVEREPWIGGKVAAYEAIFPKLECGPCVIEPEMDGVLHNERIRLLTGSEVNDVKGFFGNFNVQINKKARYVDMEKCTGCGACCGVCPVKVKNKFNGDLTERGAIYTAFPGVLPNVPVIDSANCLRFKGESCDKCQKACPAGAIDYAQKDEELDVSAGGIIVATGFDLLDLAPLKNFALGLPNVLDSYQFERLISATGPNDGKLRSPDGRAPKSIAFVHCAGSRDRNYKDYCSQLCCASTLKLAHLARQKAGPELKIYEIFSDWCLPGKGYQELFDTASGEGVEFIRVANPNTIEVSPGGENDLTVKYGEASITADMVVYSPALIPAGGSKKLAALLGIGEDKHGFFAAEDDRISPAGTTSRGIYVAGCAAGPKDVPQTVMQAQAASGMALAAIVPGEKMELEAATAHVNEKLCGACRICLPLCPYQAIRFDETKKSAVVNEFLCPGCGVCASACPAGAIEHKHYTQEQILSEIEGVLHE